MNQLNRLNKMNHRNKRIMISFPGAWLFLLAFISLPVFSSGITLSESNSKNEAPLWKANSHVENFWMQYVNSKGGLTWTRSEIFPEYSRVKEGDTFWVLMKQGPCLMEFFHGRWRRANDVRRWDTSINAYGGCPYVFD